MMSTLIVVAALVGAVLVVRWAVVLRTESADAKRTRDPTGVIVGAKGFVLDRPGAPGVLLLHGAGDTPQTLRELGDVLYSRGFAVSAPLLPGHGRRVLDFRHVTASAWRSAALAAYDEIAAGRSWTGLVGLSMGGALATLIAVDRPDARAVVLIAPYLELPRALRLGAALSRPIGLALPYFPSRGARSVRDPEAAARGVAYGAFTPAAVRALGATADAAAVAVGSVRAPTLIIQSRLDNRVAPQVAMRALARVAAADKRLEWVSEGGHVITVDYGKERVFALTADWLESHGAASLLQV